LIGDFDTLKNDSIAVFPPPCIPADISALGFPCPFRI
jgi:hypothetical protein